MKYCECATGPMAVAVITEADMEPGKSIEQFAMGLVNEGRYKVIPIFNEDGQLVSVVHSLTRENYIKYMQGAEVWELT